MRALLDTSVLIALQEHSERTPDLSDFEEIDISSLSVSELMLGLHTTATPVALRTRLRRLEFIQAQFGEGLPFDDHCAEMYDELLDRVDQHGGSPRAHRIDRMLAATAMAHELPLVTRNAADFAILRGMVDVVER